jgi:hypothetical protein
LKNGLARPFLNYSEDKITRIGMNIITKKYTKKRVISMVIDKKIVNGMLVFLQDTASIRIHNPKIFIKTL